MCSGSLSSSLEVTPLQLATALHTKKGFVWLDSLIPSASFPHEPQAEGLSLLAAEPDLVLTGKREEWPLLEKELQRRQQKHLIEQKPPGAAIGFFRFDGSFCFGFYETVYRHDTTLSNDRWNLPLPDLSLKNEPLKEPLTPLNFTSDLTASEYCKKVALAQEEIAAGNIYQICLAHRFSAPYSDHPWPLYLALRQKSPAPFAAYLQLEEETILSSSPECFLKIEDRHILTRPIKGTSPRGKTALEDEQNARFLQNSVKENAELIMITDLERNDLSQICDYGSVLTPELLKLESYPQVFHLVSTVEGQLRPSISHVEALITCFPGGSISGAPKKKALELIEKLEPAPRGLFTGAIGYFGFEGKSQFNIAIRTLHIASGKATFHVGAGITSDSVPLQEWEETLHKAEGILQATQGG